MYPLETSCCTEITIVATSPPSIRRTIPASTSATGLELRRSTDAQIHTGRSRATIGRATPSDEPDHGSAGDHWMTCRS